GVYFTVYGVGHLVELIGVIPMIQARDLHIQRLCNDLVVGTFGRGIYILDDYSALREVNEETLAGPARLFPLRPTPMFAELSQVRSGWGDQTEANPPFGATLTYHVNEMVAGQPDLVIVITDAEGERVRSLDLPDGVGVQRVTWDLRRDPPAPPAGDRGDRGGRGGRGGRGRQGALVETGHYTAMIGVRGSDPFSGYGEPQTILVIPLQR
ncbi:MAG: hypothetical protein O7A04_11515, partial [Acidobacteria bacterium]|nr:hypothetical protein [Acidobacteriota bacterium]